MSKEKPEPAATEQPAAIVKVQKSALQLRIDSAAQTIEKALSDCAIDVVQHLAPMQQTVQMAAGIALLRASLTDEVVKELFMPLQGSRLGFRTDRDKEERPGYSIAVVKDVAIEALIRGAYMTGNEVNIIAGGAYFTKEYFARKVLEWPHLTDLRPKPGVPQFNSDNTSAVVPFEVTWKLGGIPDKVECTLQKGPDGQTMIDARIPVKINKGQGPDAAIGKARRKVLAMVYERLQGGRFLPADGDALEAEGTPVGDFVTTPSQPASAGAQPAAGTAKAMDDLLNRVKPSGVGATGSTGPAEPSKNEKPMTDAERLAAEVAENERAEREALKEENSK